METDLKALEDAIIGNKIDRVRTITRSGIDLNQPIYYSRTEEIDTPLLLALERGYEDIIQELILSGADVNLHFDDFHPLFAFINIPTPEVFARFVENGGDLLAKDSEGKDALEVMVKRGRHRLIGYLKSVGYDFTQFPLYNQNAEVRYWIDYVIPVGEAIHRCDEEFLKAHLPLLKTVNASLSGPGSLRTEPRTLLSQAVIENCLPAVTLLIGQGVDLDVIVEWDSTALISAIRLSHNDLAKLLIQSGCNPAIKTKSGHTAYTQAQQCQNTEMIQLLEQLGYGEAS